MAGKYAVLDRPPTKVEDNKSQPALSNQVSGMPEDLAKKQESMPPGAQVQQQKTGQSAIPDVQK
jgi:hypothetical protein